MGRGYSPPNAEASAFKLRAAMMLNPDWDRYEFANVADPLIVDREDYERECLRQLQRADEYSPEWVARECELLEARLSGSFPQTAISVRIRIPGWPDIEEEWAIWEDEGRATQSAGDVPQRWVP